jgi:hypothetical protein
MQPAPDSDDLNLDAPLTLVDYSEIIADAVDEAVHNP